MYINCSLSFISRKVLVPIYMFFFYLDSIKNKRSIILVGSVDKQTNHRKDSVDPIYSLLD